MKSIYLVMHLSWLLRPLLRELVFTDGILAVSFLMGKSRPAPLKTVSLPRLELNTAVVVRIAQAIKKEIILQIKISYIQILDRFNTDVTVYYRQIS